MLGHEDAQVEEQMPYLGCVWPDIPVVQFWGRSATRDPPCPKEQAGFHWWRDCAQKLKHVHLPHQERRKCEIVFSRSPSPDSST